MFIALCCQPTIRDKQSSLTVKMTYDLLPRRLQPGSLDLVLDGLLQHQATALVSTGHPVPPTLPNSCTKFNFVSLL